MLESKLCRVHFMFEHLVSTHLGVGKSSHESSLSRKAFALLPSGCRLTVAVWAAQSRGWRRLCTAGWALRPDAQRRSCPGPSCADRRTFHPLNCCLCCLSSPNLHHSHYFRYWLWFRFRCCFRHHLRHLPATSGCFRRTRTPPGDGRNCSHCSKWCPWRRSHCWRDSWRSHFWVTVFPPASSPLSSSLLLGLGQNWHWHGAWGRCFLEECFGWRWVHNLDWGRELSPI